MSDEKKKKNVRESGANSGAAAKEKSKKGKSTKSGVDRRGGDDSAKSAAKTVNILDPAAMENAHNICHNVQDLLYYRGFFWEGQNKKGKGKGRKKKGGKK